MKQAERRKFHYIYKITRTDGSGKYYIGMHSTDDLEDGYFGSGQLLWKSINKHGKEQHSKEILEHLPSREALKLREKEIVNGELLEDEKCMNLKLGGEGGGKLWSLDHRVKFLAAAKNTGSHNLKTFFITSTFEQRSARAKKRAKTIILEQGCFNNGWLGARHSEETKRKISWSQQGKQLAEKNSQFGTCWITDGIKPIKICKINIDEYISKGYSIGRGKNVIHR